MFRVAIEIGDRKSRSREVGNNRIENGTEGRSALPMAAEEMNTNSTDDWHDHQRDRLQLAEAYIVTRDDDLLLWLSSVIHTFLDSVPSRLEAL